MAKWNLVYGALLMGVVSIYVAYFLPKAQSELEARERSQAIRTSLDERIANSAPYSSESTSTSSSHRSTSSNATTVKAAAALQAFVDALEKGAKASLTNLRIEPSPPEAPTFSGAVITAARDIAAGEVVVQLPASLQFNERTAHPSLRKALEDTLLSNPDVASLLATTAPEQPKKSNPRKSTYVALLSLLLQVRQQNSSQWGPWLHTLPSAAFAQETFPLFFSDDEVACLPPFDRQLYDDLIRRKDFFVNVTMSICNGGKGLPNSGEESSGGMPPQQPSTPSERLQQMACATTDGHISWAFSVFLSREIDLHGVPSMFPLMDMLPYAIDANVRPGAIETNDKGQFVFVNLVAAKDIRAGDRLTFRLGLRHPSEVFLAQGIHDRSHYDPMGVMLPFQWSEAVRDVTRSTIACGDREETIAVPTDRDVHDDLYRCAMVEDVLSELRTARSGDGAQPGQSGDSSAPPPTGNGEVTAADLDEALSARQLDVATWAPTAAVKSRVRESLVTAYAAGDADESCASSSSSSLSDSRRRRQLMEHNIFLQSAVEMIGSADGHDHSGNREESEAAGAQ